MGPGWGRSTPVVRIQPERLSEGLALMGMLPAPGMQAVRDGLTSQTACARTREGSGFPFPPGPGPRGVKVSQLAPILSIRLSEGWSRATWSSPRAFLSVGDGMLPIQRRVSESACTEAARLPEQAWRDN